VTTLSDPRATVAGPLERERLVVEGPSRLEWIGCTVLLAGLLAAIYLPVLRDLVRQWWDDPNYSHGFLVPFFSGYLVWQRRGEISALAPRGTLWGLATLFGGLGILVLGDLAGELFLLRSSLVVLLVGLVLFLLGWKALRLVSFPLAYLLFMIPLPAILFYAVAFPLQGLAAQNAASTLDLLGVPVLLDGNVIRLSHITLGVTEACSGIRSLISLLALAVAWAYLTLPTMWRMVILVASAVPITIVANAARVVATGLIGQWAGIEYATGFFHSFSGWVIFLVAALCLAGVHVTLRVVSRWPWRSRP
jgi:exosortase